MPQSIDPALKAILLGQTFRPAITLWNRLEGRPRREDFERSLRAEVRDPLWMLTRQWQFGEFLGEDAGSAVEARVALTTSHIDRFAVRRDPSDPEAGRYRPAVPYDSELPLETAVEREPVWNSGPAASVSDLRLRSQMGRHWLRLLRRARLADPDLAHAFAERFAFEDVTETADTVDSSAAQLEAAYLRSDPVSWQALRAVKGRLPDGRKLLRAIEAGEFGSWAGERFDPPMRDALEALAHDFRNWFYRLYSQPQTDGEDAWSGSCLEYQFAVSAPADAAGEHHDTLVADQYHHGHLDWHAFDVNRVARLEDHPETPFAGSRFAENPPRALLPTTIEFSGMPNPRWWEFEDRRTDFGRIRAGTTDIALLMLAEFGLIYGNDWSVIPYDLEVGSLADIQGIVVTDVFGVRTLIRAAGEGQRMDWQRWSMYQMSSDSTVEATNASAAVDDRLYLPPSTAVTQEGAPIERVFFARDEMANMVWAVEERIPGVFGNGKDGFEAAVALSDDFRSRVFPTGDENAPPGAPAVGYRLGSSVPENWIPFIGRHVPGSNRQIRLQRAAMPRISDAIQASRVEPRGRVLREGLDNAGSRRPYFIHEEEVPRAGVVVSRGFQRARWFEGKVVVWLGRRKETGRGEGSSGLGFDRVASAEAPPGDAPPGDGA